jgi:hypothetical protein
VKLPCRLRYRLNEVVSVHSPRGRSRSPGDRVLMPATGKSKAPQTSGSTPRCRPETGTGCNYSTQDNAGDDTPPSQGFIAPLRGEIVSRSTPELMYQGNNRRNQCGHQNHYPVQKSTKRFNHRNLLGDESARPWLEPSIIEPPMLTRHERRECGHDHQPSTFFTRGKQTRAVRCMSSCAPVGQVIEYRRLYRKAWPKPHR